MKYFHNEFEEKKKEGLISLPSNYSRAGSSLSPYDPVSGDGVFLVAAQRWLAGSDSLRAVLPMATEILSGHKERHSS